MLFFHKFEDIRDENMAVRYSDVDLRPYPYNVLGFPHVVMLDEISEDLWDYHFDFRSWWQAQHNRLANPVNIKVSKIVNRQLQTEYRPSGLGSSYGRPDSGIPFILNPPFPTLLPPGTVYYQDSQGPGPSHLLFGTTPFPSQGTVSPPSGAFTVYFSSFWGVAPAPAGTAHQGTFFAHNNFFNMPVSPGFTITVLRNENIANYKMARLNYLTPVDGKVLRTGDSGAGSPGDPDPQPVTAPTWKGVWVSNVRYEFGDIVSKLVGGVSHTFFCIRTGTGFHPAIAKTFWERCNRPKTQAVANAIRNVATIFLFPGRNDMMPICYRTYPSATPTNIHDWRGPPNSASPPADAFGVAAYVPEAAGFNVSETQGAILPAGAPFELSFEDRDNGPHVPGPWVETTLGDDGASYNFYEEHREYHITQIIRVQISLPF